MIERRDLTKDPDHVDEIWFFSELDRSLKKLKLQDLDKGVQRCIGYRYTETSDGYEKHPLYTWDGYRCGFDIETSTKYCRNLVDNEEGYYSAMYCAQFAINNKVIICRTWQQLTLFWNRLTRALNLSPNTVLLVWVHNLDYETSYIKHRFDIDMSSWFGKSRTRPIKYLAAQHIYLHDSFTISGTGLEKTAKMYKLPHSKLTGDLNHDKIRNSSTPLDDAELGYIANDVLALTDFAEVMYNTFLRPHGYIPDTSTQILRREIEAAAEDPDKCDILSESAIDACCKDPDQEGYKLRKRLHGTIFGYEYDGEYIPGWINPAQFTPYDKDHKALPVTGKDIDGVMCYDFYKWLFRGGYTKSNARFTSIGQWLPNGLAGDIGGDDFTSSYPFCQTIYTFPMGKFYPRHKNCQYIVDRILKNYDPDSDFFDSHRHIFIIKFTGIHSIEDMALESESKCTIEGRKIIDNGRVRYADTLTACLTDVDLALYGMYYDWKNIEVLRCWTARARVLPAYLLDVLWENGQKKQRLKHIPGVEVEYSLAKGKFNSCYGLCCKQPVYHDYKLGTVLNKDGYETTEQDTFHFFGKRSSVDHKVDYDSDYYGMYVISDVPHKTFLQTVSTSILSPFWGIWTSAFARFNLLRIVKQISNNTADVGSDVIYCDTDSAYYHNRQQHQHIIDSWNSWAAARVRARLPGIYPELMSLGHLDDIIADDSDGQADHYTRFKTLGAKRYLKSWIDKEGEHTKVTVAGLPKGVLENHCKRFGLDIYRTFDNLLDFTIDSEDIDEDEQEEIKRIKLGRVYHDRLVKINMAGEIMTEYSSCTLYKTTFKLKMIDMYIKLLQGIAQDVRGGRSVSEIWREKNDGKNQVH